MNVNEMMQSPRHLAAEVDEIAGTSDINGEGNTHFAADLAAVLASSEEAFDAEAIRYFHRLRDRIRDRLQREADEEAEAEADRLREEAEEMRSFYADREAA